MLITNGCRDIMFNLESDKLLTNLFGGAKLLFSVKNVKITYC